MVKNTNKSKPKRPAVKKTAVKKTPSQTLVPPELKKDGRLNFLPIAVFMVSALILVSLFVYLRKTLIVASINGQPLTRFEVIKILEKQNGATVVDSLVSKMLLEQEGRQQKIVISESEIGAQIKKIEKQLKAQGSSLENALAMQGVTQTEVEDQIRLRLILEKLLAGKTKVTDKEVNTYLVANRDSYPEDMSETKLKETVRQQLESQKLSTTAQKLLQELKNKAKIKYYLTY